MVCLLSQAKECARDLTGRRNTELLRQVNCSHSDSHDPSDRTAYRPSIHSIAIEMSGVLLWNPVLLWTTFLNHA